MARIGIIGSEGRMGHALERAIAEAGHDCSGGVDRGGDPAALADASDVLVDFSAPGALDANLHAAVGAGIPILVGTTGLEEKHHAALDSAAGAIAVLQTGNTSLGVTLLAHLVREAASRLGDDWDIEVLEMHHRMKVDAPSGTALLLGEAAAAGRGIELAENCERGRDGHTGARERGAIGFASLRGGTVAGEHSVILAGTQERLTLCPSCRRPDDIRARGGQGRRMAARPARRALRDGAGARTLTKEQIFEFFRRLAEDNPSPETELEYGNAFQLVVAVALSAQATDVGVNKATRKLFAEVKTPAADAGAGRGGAQGAHQDHRPVQFQGQERHRAVADAGRANLAARCRAPARIWSSCPASGARPPMSCSTAGSARRPSRSTPTSSASATAPAWRRARRPDEVEAKLEKRVPEPFRLGAHHWLILHGRYICKARTPECWRCPVVDLCALPEQGAGTVAKPRVAAGKGRRASTPSLYRGICRREETTMLRSSRIDHRRSRRVFALAACAPQAEPGSGPVSKAPAIVATGPAVNCVQTNRIRDTEVLDDNTIDFP